MSGCSLGYQYTSEACIVGVFVTTVTDKSFIQNLVYYSNIQMLYAFRILTLI